MIRLHRPTIVQRGISFLSRVQWMAPLTGGKVAAVKTLMRIRQDPDSIQLVSYGGKPVQFCGHDEQALREVLIDQEYSFQTDLLSSISVPIVLDIGSHIGTFAIWVFGVNQKARVLSVEADPKTHRTTEINVAAFVESGADWKVIHRAAGGEDDGVLRLSDSGPSMSHRIDPYGTVEVHSISLTTLLDRVAPNGAWVDLVKIDIEGSEESFLCCAPQALKRVNALVIELHPQLCNTSRVLTVLEENFDCIKEIGGRKSRKPLLYCQRMVAY